MTDNGSRTSARDRGGRCSSVGVDIGGTFTDIIPLDEIELYHPMRVRPCGLVPATGGLGRWRGCLSVVRELEFQADAGLLQVRSDRRRFRPYGLAGARAGTSSRNIIDPDGGNRALPTNITCEIPADDLFRHMTADGNGYGAPAERDLERVVADVLDEKISYGVRASRIRHPLRHYDGAAESISRQRVPTPGPEQSASEALGRRTADFEEGSE
jgi:N-methylhydantoinase B